MLNNRHVCNNIGMNKIKGKTGNRRARTSAGKRALVKQVCFEVFFESH